MASKKRNILSVQLENFYVNQLVAKAQQEDVAAFAELVKLFRARVSQIIRKYVNEPSEVEDLSQEVFLKVHRYIKTFKGESSFYTWLYSVAASIAKNYLINLKRMPLVNTVDNNLSDYLDVIVDTHENVNPQDILVSNETQTKIIDTLEKLPRILHEVLILREIEGLSYERISEVLEIPEGTVRSRIHRARQVIEENIKDVSFGRDLFH